MGSVAVKIAGIINRDFDHDGLCGVGVHLSSERRGIYARGVEVRDSGKRITTLQKGGKRGPNSGERRLPGSARVSRVGETVPVSRTFKDCFGETPKPARETRALPGSLRSPEQLECAQPI